MADTSGTPLVPLRDARLSPDDVAERSFSEVKRGYAENEVRAYLRLVADELATATKRTRELAARIESLEARLAAPAPPPSDKDLITALGEETARVLGQARESAVELRTKAEEHARNLVREAQESARQLQATTQQAAETKAREAEDAARTRANEVVAEARTMRDRVLSDLGERRQELERQVSELRAGRGKLVEAYQVVERALAQATRVIGDEPGAGSPATTRSSPGVSAPEPAAAATPGAERETEGGATDEDAGDDDQEGELPATGDPTRPVVAAPVAAASPVVSAASAQPPRRSPAPRTSPAADVRATPAKLGTPAKPANLAVPAKPANLAVPAKPTADEPEARDEPTGEPRDVGALFDRLRSGQPAVEEPTAHQLGVPAPGVAGTDVSEPEALTGTLTPTGATAEPAVVQTPAAAEGSETPEAPDVAAPGSDALARRTRDEALAPVTDDLARRAKRAVQDEQNDVLDGLRRQRGKIDATKVLIASDEQLARWAHVLQPAVDRAYEAGTASTGAPVRKRRAAVPASLLTELTSLVVTPLRTRLEESLAAVDSRSPADLEVGIAQALGARYREWRTQDLDAVLGDALAISYTRGVYDAAPQGARLRWVPEREGRCPDCDDNALEPTTKGSAFPTGQTAPPAHPGCRCLLVVETGS